MNFIILVVFLNCFIDGVIQFSNVSDMLHLFTIAIQLLFYE